MSIESIPHYLSSSDDFIQHRLKYYSIDTPIPISIIKSKLFPNSTPNDELEKRAKTIERLQNTSEDVIVVTSTIDRPDDVMRAYTVLESQKTQSWSWVVIDNGIEKLTEKNLLGLNDQRVFYVRYTERTGCASPARNAGLDVIHLAKWKQNQSPHVIVVDSDDSLYGPESLTELLKISKSKHANRNTYGLIHGFSATQIMHPSGNITNVPNPRDYGSDFPKVNNLKEVFDKGLNILSGMFPIELLGFLRYPNEFSFEDDGFNQKLLLQAKRMGLVWIADNIPTTIKVFHSDSMSGKNDKRGDVHDVNKIGLHKVSGVRAKIVTYLKDITDFYTREEL